MSIELLIQDGYVIENGTVSMTASINGWRRWHVPLNNNALLIDSLRTLSSWSLKKRF